MTTQSPSRRSCKQCSTAMTPSYRRNARGQSYHTGWFCASCGAFEKRLSPQTEESDDAVITDKSA